MSTDASTPEPKRFAGFLLSDTIALTALPIVAYLILFIYRIGYFSVFALPYQYIELSIGEVFFVIGGLVLTWVSGLFAVDSFLNLIPAVNFPPVIRRRYRVIAPVFIVAFTPLVLGSYQPSEFYTPARILISVILLAIDFVLPLFTHRQTPGYMNKLAAGDEYQRTLDTFHSSVA